MNYLRFESYKKTWGLNYNGLHLRICMYVCMYLRSLDSLAKFSSKLA